MVDLAATQLQANGVDPLASHVGSQAEAAAAKPPKVLPPPFTGEVDRLFRQLEEIHAIAATQLAECIHWLRSKPTPNTAYAGAGW
jgi:hypothetical protein